MMMPEHQGRFAANPQVAKHMSQAQPDSPKSGGQVSESADQSEMKSRFPRIHNEGKATKGADGLTFTYIDSYGLRVKQTLPELSPKQIVDVVKYRMESFEEAMPGAREGDPLRSERKYISAHDEPILRQAWELMDDHEKMELEMMLDRSSHHGISDPAWVKENVKAEPDIPFAGGENAS